MDGHLGSFHLPAVVTSAAVNKCVQGFENLFLIPLGVYLGVELPVLCNSMFNFFRTFSLNSYVSSITSPPRALPPRACIISVMGSSLPIKAAHCTFAQIHMVSIPQGWERIMKHLFALVAATAS